MGIALQGFASLFLEMKNRPFAGRILQLGRQDIYFDHTSLKKWAQTVGLSLAKVDHIGHRPNQWKPTVQTLDDITFFKLLGFDTVESIDASDYENPTFVHDFNLPIRDDLKGKYDFVYDGGSLEHIFNVPCALANIASLLKVGGRVLHETPMHNFIDHGFYQFSPGFFYDYYEANHYTSIKCRISGMTLPMNHDAPPKIFDYEPGMLENISVGGFRKEIFHGCEMLGNVVVAEKTAATTGTVMPVQRRYRQWWSSEQFQNKS